MGRLDDLLALLWGVAGLAVAGWFAYLALGPGSLASSRWPLLGLAVVALAGFTTVAVRHHRAAVAARAERASGPVGGWLPKRVPDAGSVRVGHATPPELSEQGRAALARIVGILDRAGLLGPRAPRPADLMTPVADAGEPVTLETVLAAIGEIGVAGPVFHDGQVEQLPETLRAQVADLARLTGTGIAIEHLEVGDRRTELTLLAVGKTIPLSWRSHPKLLSTVLHVAVARALPEVPLVWTWADQGVWLAVPRTDVRALNVELGRAGSWTLVARTEPTAAGEVRRRRD